jgi:enoyl-CoA hydratase/carnithine racemase
VAVAVEGGMSTTPILEVDGPLATITLNRPAHRNRLHDEDLAVLLAHFDRLEADAAVRVVVLTGKVLPERPVFCAGYHLGDAVEGADAPTGDRFEQVADALERLRPITLAAVNGSVFGGATDLVLACDFAIGVRGMRMRMPAARIGLHYYPGGISRFVSRLGVVQAKRAFLGADTFDDHELLAMGFVGGLADAAGFDAAVTQRVQGLLALAPMAQQSMKQSLNEAARGDFNPVRLRQRLEATQRSEDLAEGARAFAERRVPVFQGR